MTGHARPPVVLATATVLLAVATAASLGAAALLVLDATSGEAVTWVLGRAGGLASYVLLLALVVTGLVQAHPWSRHLHTPSPRTRLTVHVSLATFTLVFTVLHVVVLALDPWAQVGWRGAVLPMASGYRPVPVTLGVIALWAGLLTGVTAAFAGRFAARVWWPIHKVAAVVLVLVWAHSVLAGSDVALLQGFYLATGSAVVALGISRYAARTPADRVAELTRDLDASRGPATTPRSPSSHRAARS
ncbi:ferric reductase-like transmembrane domain-containing protein [Actinotalea sp.]|uniref:ferric reductase-like transmembrane domain-containing protein n=1 Tax=Actinotalea sp. TaxID=1872145 RepID=UPI003561E154